MELYVLLVVFVVGTAGNATVAEVYKDTYNWMFGGVDNAQGSYVLLGDRLNVLNSPMRASKVKVKCYAANCGVAPIHASGNGCQWECKRLRMEFKGYTEDVGKIPPHDAMSTVFTIIADETLKFVVIRGNGPIDSPKGDFVVQTPSLVHRRSALKDFIYEVVLILLDLFRTEVETELSQMS